MRDKSNLTRLPRPFLERVKQPEAEEWIDIEEYYQDIKLSLERLLNSQAMIPSQPNLSNIEKSVLSYGLEPFFKKTNVTNEEKQTLCQRIKEKIEIFEPRIASVEVSLANSKSTGDQSTLKIHIIGEIQLANQAVPANYETTFDEMNQQFEVN